MPRMITIFTGSFKPPTRAHFQVVKTMLDCSRKPRKGNKGSGTVYIFISKKEREPCMGITKEVSKKVWQEYLSVLPESDRKRVRLVASNMTSPVQTAYGFVKKVMYPGDLFFLVKSSKDANNQRYSSFDSLKKDKRIIFKELVIPGYKSPRKGHTHMSSTGMREAAHLGKKKEFYAYLPRKLKESQKLKLWQEMKKLCS